MLLITASSIQRPGNAGMPEPCIIELMAMTSTRHRRERRMWSMLLVAGLTATYVGYALTQPIAALQPTVSYHFSQQATPVNLQWPGYGESAVGAMGYGVLETHGSTVPIPTASTIKVLTALAVLRQKPLAPGETGPMITITQDDMDSYRSFVARDGSVVAIELGEQLSEHDALEALLLPSANNIAVTLARWAFGSIDSYNTYANAYAHELGMVQTTVTDPSGFDPSTVSTAHDLVLLGEAAMANPVIAGIVAQPSATIPVQGEISNVNFLLGQDGIVGLKTGNNDQDPGAFLLASNQLIDNQKVTIVSVTMNGPDLWTAMNDNLKLLRSTAAGFTTVTLSPQTAAARYTAPWGSTALAVPSKAHSAVLWRDAPAAAEVTFSPLQAPATAGAVVGSITITSRDHTLASVPLVLAQDLPAPPITWRLSHPEYHE